MASAGEIDRESAVDQRAEEGLSAQGGSGRRENRLRNRRGGVSPWRKRQGFPLPGRSGPDADAGDPNRDDARRRIAGSGGEARQRGGRQIRRPDRGLERPAQG